MDAPTSTRERPRRYWRDSVDPEPAALDIDAGDEAGGRGRFRGGIPWQFPNGQKPGPALIAALALVLLAIIALIWFLNRGDGDDDTPTPTPTQESVIDAAPSATEADDQGSTPSGFVPPRRTPTAIPTEEVRRGGDNQLDRDDDGTPGASTGDPLADIELGPVASQCQDRCLVRIAAGSDVEELMSTAGTRPSFSADGWEWVIASPEGIAWFEQNTETTMVSESSDTLRLYVAKVPNEEKSDDRIDSFGTVLDSVDSWRVVQTASVPANVKPLTDWGYQVDKVAPAPPLEIERHEELTAIETIEIGSLIDDVASNNIEESIHDLVEMGSSDGSGLGTRYYTSAANMEAAEYLFTRLESYGLTVWYEDFLSWEGYLMVNVIGEVAGEDSSAVYGVMAHFDTISEDLSTAPGADDNATGLAGSLEIARILSGYELHHPVRVIFVNVEEVGIVGSEQFAKRAEAEGTPYEGIFNLDAIGAARQYNYLVLNGNSDTQWMADLFIRLNDAYGLGQAINSQYNEDIVADDNRLRDYGFDSMMITRELYGQNRIHHSPGDTFDTLRIEGVVSCAQLTLISLAALAQA